MGLFSRVFFFFVLLILFFCVFFLFVVFVCVLIVAFLFFSWCMLGFAVCSFFFVTVWFMWFSLCYV